MYNNPDNFVRHQSQQVVITRKRRSAGRSSTYQMGGGEGEGRGGRGEGRDRGGEGRWRERGWQTSELSLGSDLQSEESESDRLQGTFHA